MQLVFFLALLFTCGLQAVSFAAPAGIVEDARLRAPEFWQALLPDGDTPILSPQGVAAYNRAIAAASPSVHDLRQYPAAVPAARLRGWMETEVLEGALYQAGRLVSWEEKQALLRERNMDALASGTVPVRRAVTVRRLHLRALPLEGGLFSSSSDRVFDVLQETAVDPAEPVLLLHTSASGAFYYAQTRNYRGWLRAADVAQTTPETWLRYASPQAFLVVTANRFALTTEGERLLYQMGAKLPLRAGDGQFWEVFVPARGADGRLAERIVRIRADEAALHEGFLPYTRNQILRQSFRFLDDPYGWGGLSDSVDCSSLVADVYRTVGVELPRNADEQEQTAGVDISLTGLSAAQKREKLRALQPGDALFFDGHTMLYLGEANGAPYILHALGSHTRHDASGGREKIRTMQVVVSDLSLRRYSGVSFLSALTRAKAYRLPGL